MSVDEFMNENGIAIYAEADLTAATFRIVKRDGIALWKNWLIRLASVLVALLLSGLFIYSVTKLNPIDALRYE